MEPNEPVPLQFELEIPARGYGADLLQKPSLFPSAIAIP